MDWLFVPECNMGLDYQTKSKPSGAALIWKGKITTPVDVQPLVAAYDPRCYFDVAREETWCFTSPAGLVNKVFASL